MSRKFNEPRPILVWLVLFASVLVVSAAEKADFQALTEFRAAVWTNEILALSGVDIVKLANGKNYLLSLGTAANQANQNTSAQAKLDTRKVAEAKARKAAAEFLSVEVHAEDKLVTLRKTERVTRDDGLKTEISRLIKVREEIIAQKSEAILAGTKTVATWLSDDGASFNAVVASEITDSSVK